MTHVEALKRRRGQRPGSGYEFHAAHSCNNPPCLNYRHLRWATVVENQHDKIAHGTALRGAKHPQTKLTEDDVRLIRSEVSRFKTPHQALAERFGEQPGGRNRTTHD